MIQIKELIDGFVGKLNKTGWVNCPLCHEEWNRLRPCSYMQDGQTVGTYACVTCAESIQSIEKVFQIFGLGAVSIHSKRRKQPYFDLFRAYGDKFDNPRCFKCKIESANPIVTCEIETEDVRLAMTHLETKSTIRFENIFQCASYFKHLMNEVTKKPEKDSTSWND